LPADGSHIAGRNSAPETSEVDADGNRGVVRVLLFAALREAAGVRQIELQFEDAVSQDEFIADLVKEVPAVARYRSSLRIAVNMQYVDQDAVVRPGDEVAIITPVSGG